jgi:hypothetical protein
MPGRLPPGYLLHMAHNGRCRLRYQRPDGRVVGAVWLGSLPDAVRWARSRADR